MKKKNKGHAVCAVIINDENKILAVSRKNNKNIFGLPGGKVDPEDGENYEKSIIREVLEETGLEIFNCKEIDVRDYSEDSDFLRTQHCFKADFKGEIDSREELDKRGEYGIVKWLNRDEFNFYKEYNNWMFDILKIE